MPIILRSWQDQASSGINPPTASSPIAENCISRSKSDPQCAAGNVELPWSTMQIKQTHSLLHPSISGEGVWRCVVVAIYPIPFLACPFHPISGFSLSINAFPQLQSPYSRMCCARMVFAHQSIARAPPSQWRVVRDRRSKRKWKSKSLTDKQQTGWCDGGWKSNR